MTFPLLTERLRLEPLTLRYAERFAEYRRDPDIARFQGWDTTYSIELATDLIESQECVELPAEGEWLQIAASDRRTDELIGDVAIHRIGESDGSWEIGFTVAREFHGNGYAVEAAAAVITYLSETAHATRFIAHTDVRNSPSIAVLRKLGFTLDPSLRQSEEFKGETVWVDTYVKYSVDPGIDPTAVSSDVNP